MHIKYENNLNDLVDAAIHIHSNVKSIIVKTGFGRIILSSMLIIFLLIYMVTRLAVLEALLISIGIVLFILRLFKGQTETYLRKHYHRQLRELYAESYLEEFNLELNEDYILVESSSKQAKTYWHDIKKIEVSDKFALFIRKQQVAIIVPRRFFPQPRTFTQFWVRARQLCDTYKKKYQM